ncbi:DUF3551 domain-containing protein [Bradyrhizobium vignae]|uniref:DUF3551 domain-containing protein n=1 Tax=Bradyrhizobium vignae TaxID=1549949 RepID=A0ABS4A0D4_9BRAD|nr:DUF3551 domain-containing protein [Bradyrhizobium vignae]MBP0113428.1 DUF3551 domain-containing protein [Bradyrhizobium vignae]RXG97440.1 DUF3551 domain-containing protein [Bradyrhizobium vignae]
MTKIIASSSIAAAALAAATFWGTAEPAIANNYEYCRVDYALITTRICSFDTMEQCLATISGRGGSCTRDPFYETESFAYAPKSTGRRHKHRQASRS